MHAPAHTHAHAHAPANAHVHAMHTHKYTVFLMLQSADTCVRTHTHRETCVHVSMQRHNNVAKQNGPDVVADKPE